MYFGFVLVRVPILFGNDLSRSNYILLNPVTFSCFDNKRVTTPDFSRGKELKLVKSWTGRSKCSLTYAILVFLPDFIFFSKTG